ncbi:MAG: class IV adenylate cyclase, partial [Spirochaetota bacterium]|nr:class IV adenylate cyclase [Spirochaetota bacterium]
LKSDIYYIIGDIEKNKVKISNNDKIFRVRSSEDKLTVTFKEKKINDFVEVNVEEEFNVNDKKSFELFASYIGARELVKKIKHVKVFSRDDILLEYVNLHGLGYFLEVEIMCEREKDINIAIGKINKIFNEFGIEEKYIEEKMYIEMLLEQSQR